MTTSPDSRVPRGGRGAVIRIVSKGLLVGALLGGCATTGAPTTPDPDLETPAWRLPAETEGTQRLFRFRYDGPEGDGSGRITLRLADGSTFRLDVADRLGRSHWTLATRDDETVWIDRDRGLYCRDLRRMPLPGLGEAPIDPGSVPRLLLGRVPATPAAAAMGESLSSFEDSFRDGAGRRWSFTANRLGRVRRWTLSVEGEPRWWWRRDGEEAVLSQRGARRQLRWEELVVEPMGSRLEPLRVPPGFTERCDAIAG